MVRVFERLVEVVRHDQRAQDKIVVVLIDGANINKMLSETAVNPNKVLKINNYAL